MLRKKEEDSFIELFSEENEENYLKRTFKKIREEYSPAFQLVTLTPFKIAAVTAFDRLLTERFPARFLIMFWGEHFHYGRNGKNEVVASLPKTEKIADLPPNEMIDIPSTTVTGPDQGDTTDTPTTTTTKTMATIPSVSSKIAGRKSGWLNLFHKIVNKPSKK